MAHTTLTHGQVQADIMHVACLTCMGVAQGMEHALTVLFFVYFTALANGTWMMCFKRSRSMQQIKPAATSTWTCTRCRMRPWRLSRASSISGRICACEGARSSRPVISHRLSRIAEIIMSMWCAHVYSKTLPSAHHMACSRCAQRCLFWRQTQSCHAASQPCSKSVRFGVHGDALQPVRCAHE